MNFIISLLFLCVFGFSSAAEDEPKCSIYDSECQRKVFQNWAMLAKSGLPEIGLPVIDPFKLNNISTSILGLWDLTLVDGQAEGIRNCILTSYVTDMEKRLKMPKLMCNSIVIKGSYKLIPAPITQESRSLNINGDGKMTMIMDNWSYNITYPFEIVKHDDGQIYVEGVFDKATYTSKVGKVTIQADGIKIGHWDISMASNRWMNDNWRQIMYSDVGKFIFDKAVSFYYSTYNTFYTKTPAVDYYSDDFESLLNETTPNEE